MSQRKGTRLLLRIQACSKRQERTTSHREGQMPFSPADLALSVHNLIWVSVQHLGSMRKGNCWERVFFPANAYSGWGTATLLMLQPKQPHTLVSGVMGYVQWGPVTECVSQGLCVSLCHGTLSILPSNRASESPLSTSLKEIAIEFCAQPLLWPGKGIHKFLRSQQRQEDKGHHKFKLLENPFLWGLPHTSSLLQEPWAFHWHHCELDLVPGFSPPRVNTVHQSSVHQRVKPELRWISWNFTKPFAFFSTERHAIKMPNVIPLELYFVFNLISFMCITIGSFSLGKALHHTKPHLRKKPTSSRTKPFFHYKNLSF